MKNNMNWLLICALLSGAVLGIPPLYRWISTHLGGPWLPLLLGWVTVFLAVIAYFER